MAPTKAEGERYTLHIFPFSLYSIMVRLTLALGRRYHGESSSSLLPQVNLKLVNLHRDMEMEEEYLRINPKGQVPALTLEGREPLTDSLDISYFFCRKYLPKMLPELHKDRIQELLTKLHDISGPSLSVKEESITEELMVEWPNPQLYKLLARNDISDDYRRALEFKKQYFKQTLAIALRPDKVNKAKAQTSELFEDLVALYKQNDSDDADQEGRWLFGSSTGPTILDAHVAPFIARLIDAEKASLVPEILMVYAKRIMSLPAWEEVLHGRSTLWNVSYGHVHLMGPQDL